MINFMKHYVTDGNIKIRVHYHYGTRLGRNGSPAYKAVVLYAKDYGSQLSKLFESAQNDTDIMTDYFDKDKVVILPSDPLFPAAFARCKGDS